MLAALCAASVGACFPDESLKALDASSDATANDLGSDATVDGPADDQPDVPVSKPDASDDAPDAVEPADAGRCTALPRDPVGAMTVYERLPDATDFVFDGAGQLAVASLRDVSSIGAMDVRSLLFPSLPGNVTALRYLPSGDLVMAMVPTSPMGTLGGGAPGEGAIYTAATGDAGAPTLRVSVGRAGGLAVDAEGTVWFSDTPRNRVFRMTLRAGGVDVVPMITDVTAPTWLAFDQSGRVLYVASTVMGGSVYRVTLSRTVLGDLMPSDAVGVLRGVGSVSGLAVDACDNVYVADETAGRIVRAADPWMDTTTTLVTESPNVRAIAFGQGGTFGNDTLFFLTGGAVRAASVRAPGVALPVPPR